MASRSEGERRPAAAGQLEEDVPGPDRLAFFIRLSRRREAVAAYRVGDRPAFLIQDPTLVGHVLAYNQAGYVNPPHPYASLAPLLTPEGRALLRLERRPGEETGRLLGRIGAVTAKGGSRLLDALTPAAAGGAPVDLRPPLAVTFLEIVVEILLGVEIGDRAAAVAAAVDVIEEDHATGGLAGRPTDERPRLARALELQEETAASLVAAAGRRRPAAVPGDAIGRRRLVSAVIRTLANGFIGSATAGAWTLWLLARHPEVQRKVRREVDRLSEPERPTLPDVAHLPYARQVVSEALRLYPPAWLLGRESLTPEVLGGRRVPAGSILSICPFTLHRHPAWWPDPERFDPARFGPGRPGRSGARPRYAYLPFGGGTRRCPGAHLAVQQLLLVLATLVRRLEFAPCLERPVVPRGLISLRPHPGVLLRPSLRGDE